MTRHEKQCFKCGLVLGIEHFYAHKMMADGHLNKCKECTKRDAKETRLARIDHYREYDKLRASMPHRKELAKRVRSEWLQEFPNRRAAQILLGNAVRDGKIIPQPCMVCGRKAEAHHPDYDTPLDVVWLCPPHHAQAHALVRTA